MPVPGHRLLIDRDPARLRERARAWTARSYRDPFALVARLESGRVGIDIERIGPVDRRFAESICTPAELVRLAGWLDSPETVASLWSGKEALSKALGDAVQYDPRRLEGPLSWPGGRSGRWRAVQVDVPAGHVGWLVWEEGR